MTNSLIAYTNVFLLSPKKIIEKEKGKLRNLEEGIKSVQHTMTNQNNIYGLIRLFQITSPLYDKGGFDEVIEPLNKRNYGQLNEYINAFEKLNRHIRCCGRDKSGLNRTEVGEEPNAHNVYLGNIFGIWTFPASHWLENKERLKKELHPEISKNPDKPVSEWYCINEYQAGSFLKNHVEGITEQVDYLNKKWRIKK